MGRHSLTIVQDFRARLFYELIINNCSLTDYAMDLAFRTDIDDRVGEERYRIFAKMKDGRMPYSGDERTAFVERIRNYVDPVKSRRVPDGKRLRSAADAYDSILWRLLEEDYSEELNFEIIKICIKRLNLNKKYPDLPVMLQLFEKVGLPKYPSVKNITEASQKLVETYSGMLRLLLVEHESSLDALAFVICLYRNALMQSKLPIAQFLYLESLGRLWAFIGTHHLSKHELFKELMDITFERMPPIAPRANKLLTGNLLKDLPRIQNKHLKRLLQYHNAKLG